MGGGRVGKKRLPTDMGVMLRIGKAKTSTKITFVAVLRLNPPNRRRLLQLTDARDAAWRRVQAKR